MNERGHYGNGTFVPMAYIGQETSKPKDSPLSGLIVAGVIFAGVTLLLGRYANREMKDTEREYGRARERQKFLDLPDREAAAFAKEIGLRSGMSQAAQDRALDAYLKKKGQH